MTIFIKKSISPLQYLFKFVEVTNRGMCTGEQRESSGMARVRERREIRRKSASD